MDRLIDSRSNKNTTPTFIDILPNDNQNSKTTEEIIYYALGHSNYRHIDTAHAYNNEKDIGRAIKRAMKDFGILR